MSKTILLTGANGFLGRNLQKKLLDTNYNVIPLSSKMCDLTQDSQVACLFNNYEINYIIHLAAVVGGIGANQLSPWEFYDKNITMGNNLIRHAVRQRKYLLDDKDAGPLFIQLGTICSYAKFAQIPFKEEKFWCDGFPEETNAPYGIAKKALFAGLIAANKQYNLNYVYVTPTNLFGPHDHFDGVGNHVIPALIKKFADAKKNGDNVLLWGNGSATRDFLYVEDCCDAIVKCLTEPRVLNQHINLGSENEICIQNLANLIADEMQFYGPIIWDSSKPNGQPRRLVNISKAKDLLGWCPKTSFKDGLRKTIKWFNDHIEKE